MGDPLSIAASIIAVVQLSAVVVKAIHGRVGAKKERKRLRDEVCSCELILKQLQDAADGDKDDKWLETMRMLERPGGPLSQLFNALTRVKRKLQERNGFLATLRWPFDEADIEQIIAEIERGKGLLQLALTNDTWFGPQLVVANHTDSERKLARAIQLSSLETRKDLLEVKDDVLGIRDNVNHLHEHHIIQASSEKRERILKWLAERDFVARLNDCLSRRESGTGQWLLGCDEFQDWLEPSSQVPTLFCPGIPGAGKTILSAIVIEHLQEKFRNDRGVGIAYVFGDFQRSRTQTAQHVLASLARQLVQNLPSLPQELTAAYTRHVNKGTRPSVAEVVSMLLPILQNHSRVFILVDALDEFEHSSLGFLNEMFYLQSKTAMHIFATSRFVPEIMEKFHGAETREIRATDEDIQRYVDSTMSSLPQFVRNSFDLQEEIKNAVVNGVDGMFLLGHLYMDSLIGKRSPKAIRSTLVSFLNENENNKGTAESQSQALRTAYSNALDRIEKQKGDFPVLGRQVLSWLALCQRPLSTKELQVALAVELGAAALDTDNLSSISDLVSACAGLATLDAELDNVRLVHYTTKDYLESIMGEWYPDAQRDITNVCLTYLSFSEFESGTCQTTHSYKQRLDSHILFEYAAKHWGIHSSSATTMDSDLALRFLRNASLTAAAGQALLYHELAGEHIAESLTGLHLTAIFGLSSLASTLVLELREVKKQRRDPLSYAAEKGHTELVRLLLNAHPSSVNVPDSFGSTPLAWASAYGHVCVVQQLLDSDGVDTNSKDRYGRTALSWAARHNHEETARLLLADKRVDPNRADLFGRRPIWFATSAACEEVALLLISDARVEVECKDTIIGRTPLIWATVINQEPVVQALLDRNADPTVRDVNGLSALSIAVRFNLDKILDAMTKCATMEMPCRQDTGFEELRRLAQRSREMTAYPIDCEDISVPNEEDWVKIQQASREEFSAIDCTYSRF
ncbi:hypothetical protein BJX64DRAFT_53254 [Aspergillus heterothallicus]